MKTTWRLRQRIKLFLLFLPLRWSITKLSFPNGGWPNSKPLNIRPRVLCSITTSTRKPRSSCPGLMSSRNSNWIRTCPCRYNNVHWPVDVFIPLFRFPQSALVHTPESIRTRFFVDLLMDHKHPVMLVGSAGCGKTVLMNEKLASLSENYAVTNIPFNYYTTSGNRASDVMILLSS